MADDARALRRGSTLVMRNVRVGPRRTSLRLESAVWEALQDIARREGLPLNRLLARIAGAQSESSFTASVRVYALGYYRGLAQRAEGA